MAAPELLPRATQGLLIYLPYSNSSAIKLNGTAGMDITGSVFAPASNISLSGDFGNQAMNSQWVGKTVYMSGTLNAIISSSRKRKTRLVLKHVGSAPESFDSTSYQERQAAQR